VASKEIGTKCKIDFKASVSFEDSSIVYTDLIFQVMLDLLKPDWFMIIPSILCILLNALF